MAWMNKQKQIAAIACKHAGIDAAARKFILRQFPNSILPGSDEPSSTAAALDQRDFERFMAIVEDRAGGELRTFTPGYWSGKAASRSTSASERQAHKIRELYDELVDRGGKLAGHGIYGFEGLVRRVTNHRTADLDQLDPREAYNLIEMLNAMLARARKSPDDASTSGGGGGSDRQTRMFSDRELSAAGVGCPASRNSAGATDDPIRRPMEADDIPF